MVGIKSLVVLVGAALPVLSLPANKRAPQAVPNSYIVTLKSDAAVDSHLTWVKKVRSQSFNTQGTTGVEQVYNVGDFKGYAGSFDDETINQIKTSDQVRLANYLSPRSCLQRQ